MADLVLARSDRGEWGVHYKLRTGLVTRVYCTDPAGVSARVTFTDGTVVEHALDEGRGVSIPSDRVLQVLRGPGDERQLAGVQSISFQWGG